MDKTLIKLNAIQDFSCELQDGYVKIENAYSAF